MKIENPSELAQRIKEIEEAKRENEQLADENKSLLSEKEALEAENTALKDEIQEKTGAVETEKQATESEQQKVTNLLVEVEALKQTNETLQSEVATLKNEAQAAKNVAERAEAEAEAIRDQNALLAENLDASGVAGEEVDVPAVDSHKANPNAETIERYYRLKNSSNARERAEAIRLFNSNPAVSQHVTNKIENGLPKDANEQPAARQISDEDKKVYQEYKRLSEERDSLNDRNKNNKNPEIRARRAQAQNAVQRFYNQHSDIIHKCAGAEALDE